METQREVTALSAYWAGGCSDPELEDSCVASFEHYGRLSLARLGLTWTQAMTWMLTTDRTGGRTHKRYGWTPWEMNFEAFMEVWSQMPPQVWQRTAALVPTQPFRENADGNDRWAGGWSSRLKRATASLVGRYRAPEVPRDLPDIAGPTLESLRYGLDDGKPKPSKQDWREAQLRMAVWVGSVELDLAPSEKLALNAVLVYWANGGQGRLFEQGMPPLEAELTGGGSGDASPQPSDALVAWLVQARRFHRGSWAELDVVFNSFLAVWNDRSHSLKGFG